MTELELLLAALGVLLLWNLILTAGMCDYRRSDLEEYRFAYQFYKDEYERVADRVYTDQEREAIHDRFVEGRWEHMTRAGYPPIERKG